MVQLSIVCWWGLVCSGYLLVSPCGLRTQVLICKKFGGITVSRRKLQSKEPFDNSDQPVRVVNRDAFSIPSRHTFQAFYFLQHVAQHVMDIFMILTNGLLRYF